MSIWPDVLHISLEGEKLALVEKAAAFAEHAHAGLRREFSSAPCFTHPMRLAVAASLLPDATPELVAAAFLHVTVDDGAATDEEIRKEFGGAVADLVAWMTKPSKSPAARGRKRAEKEAMDKAHHAKAPNAVKRLMMLDVIDNLSELERAPPKRRDKYARESLELAALIGNADPALNVRLVEAARRLLV